MHRNDAQLVLFGTEYCHLCEEAEGVLVACGLRDRYRLVDISADDQLMAQYGLRIPVLTDTSQELDWPFDQHAVNDFLAAAGEKH